MSTQSSDKNKRIAKNTLLVYFHMLFMIEPYASMYCQQFDDFKNVADFLEFAAKLMRRQ